MRSNCRTSKGFETKIYKNESGCWIWTGSLDSKQGYGMLGPSYEIRAAHRLSWTIYKGPIPDGLCVLHRCDIKRCVNPEHLFLGTDLENRDDAMSKGLWSHQSKTHCNYGHEFTPENTYSRPGMPHRECRICSRKSKTAWRNRQHG